MARKVVAGNWKMHGLGSDLPRIEAIASQSAAAGCEVLLCVPATLIERACRVAGPDMAIGGEDCHPKAQGAHTGEVSGAMLADAGASHVILGHSERRADHGETDAIVAQKVEAALEAGLIAIVCLGETLSERDAGATLSVVGRQLVASIPTDAEADRLIIAYEPVWAIGTGRTPTTNEIAEVHAHLRAGLARRFGPEKAADVPLLYGGSVKPNNAAAIFALPEVDGALVGGASLDPVDFGPIITALDPR